MPPTIQYRVRTAVVAAVAAWTATCASPTDPLQYVAIPLQELRLYNFSILRDSGVVIITGVPQDTARVLAPSERLRLELATSSGDSEALELSPIICNEFQLSCHIVDVVMKDGSRVDELFSLLDSVEARTFLTSFGGKLGSAFVAHPERVPDAVKRIGSHPGVESAERSWYAASPPPRKWAQEGGLPLDFQSARVRDGVIQAMPGNVLTVRYSQPNSTVLEFALTIPVP